MKIEIYEYAMKMAKICLEICPESFEAHMVLAQCFLYEKDIYHFLVTLNAAPAYEDSSSCWHHIPAFER